MASGQRKPIITIFAVLVLGAFLLSTLLYGTEARPLSGSRLQGNVARETAAGIQELFLAAVKDSGPSPGVGHRYRNFQIVGVVKDAGPSPGEGHKSSNAIDNP